jgi:hypothetical protein
MSKRLRLSIIALLIVGVVLSSPLFLSVYSATNPTTTISNIDEVEQNKIVETITDVNTDTNDEVHCRFFAGYTSYTNADGTKTITIEMDMESYNDLSQEKKETAMQLALDDINSSEISFTNRTKLYNFVANEDVAISSLVRQLSDDVNADFGSAYSIFKPWSGIVGTILGILALAIFILLALTICFDLAYMTIPIWRNFLDGGTEQGKKPRTVSLEAYKAVQAVENDNSGTKEVVSEYMKQKVKQMVAIAICLLYLVSGQIYAVIAQIIDYFQGVLS